MTGRKSQNSIRKLMKKALLMQSLFLCLLAGAQEIELDKPIPGEPLDDVQEFVVTATGEAPVRVELHINGRLLKARRKPPFRFEVRWNTRRANEVTIKARYASGAIRRIDRTFEEIRTDYQEELQAFQCWPMLDRSLPQQWSFRSDGKKTAPQSLIPADRFTLDLVIILDISGSMKHVLGGLGEPLKQFLAECDARNYQTRMMIFDGEPRLLNLSSMPSDPETLYRGQGKSVIWDAVATGAGMFAQSPRRMLLLISDGADDGSSHDNRSVEKLLFDTGAILVWLNPTTHSERFLGRVADRSGGFSFFGEDKDAWSKLLTRMKHQYHLLAPDANWPIKLSISPGKAWVPEWGR